jgi:1-deoxy-D-xylulose-5-phosphate synthase
MSDTTLLNEIQEPADLRKLPREQVEQVAGEIRNEIIDRVSRTGGHLASSLGAV